MHEMDWPPRQAPEGQVVAMPGLRVEVLAPGGAALVSGDLDAAATELCGGAPQVGLGGRVGAPPFLAVIARDRGLLVTPAPLDVGSGWDRRGFVVTPADDAWLFLAITGPRADEVIAEGCAADPDGGSPSAATLFAGLAALLMRHPDGYLLGVEAPDGDTLLRWLDAFRQASA